VREVALVALTTVVVDVRPVRVTTFPVAAVLKFDPVNTTLEPERAEAGVTEVIVGPMILNETGVLVAPNGETTLRL